MKVGVVIQGTPIESEETKSRPAHKLDQDILRPSASGGART